MLSLFCYTKLRKRGEIDDTNNKCERTNPNSRKFHPH